ncbi:MAG: hypothetical protein Q4F41_20645 [Eubacteriales bacterium]|nr:hypothetical protein [Eubacteriales bacterium]
MAEEFKLLSFLKGVLKESYGIRKEKLAEGIHAPMFLAANITDHSNQQGSDSYLMRMRSNPYINQREDQYLSAMDWDDVFFEAEQLGVRIIFIKGGEPLTRKCILERAARYRKIYFPVITNGSMMDDTYLDFFRQNRNLIPILNMARCFQLDVSQNGRASFMYGQMMQSMEELRSRGLLFGTIETITRENYRRVLSRAYLNELQRRGSSIVIYMTVECPNGSGTFTEEEKKEIEKRLIEEQEQREDMVLGFLPRADILMERNILQREGLFEITPTGIVEPAPYRTDGVQNVREHSLTDILRDDLYKIMDERGFAIKKADG